MVSGPQRIEAHRTDTSAVRRLMSELHSNWIIRDMSDRDYGIDLMLEYYDDDNSTGRTALFQVKGTKDEIEKLKGKPVVSFNGFPVKTLLYAEQFPQPFFLIYLSTAHKDGPIYYVWLQKYIELALDGDVPDWRNKKGDDTVTIHIPEVNNFKARQNDILKILSDNANTQKRLRFLILYGWWKKYFDELKPERIESHKRRCLSVIERFEKIQTFIEDNRDQDATIDFKKARENIKALDGTHQDDPRLEALDTFNSYLANLANAILMTPDIEIAEREILGTSPY